MRNVSQGKVTSGPNGKPSIKTSAPSQGGPRMPNVGGHTTNNASTPGVGPKG